MHPLEITEVSGQGKIDNEAVWMVANEDIPDLGYYTVVDSTYGDDTETHLVSNKHRHLYWFKHNYSINKGDRICLSTKMGSDYTFKANNGATVHVMHWNLKESVWNKDGDRALVFRLRSWMSKSV